MGAQKNGPEVVRYGLWRIYALRLAAVGPTWLGEIQRELQRHEIHVVVGTLGPALDQLVEQGLLVRDPDTSLGIRLLRITDLGRRVLATVHADIAGLNEAIGATLAGREPAETGTQPAVAAPMRVTAEDVVTFLLEQEQSIAKLRGAVRAIQREAEQVGVFSLASLGASGKVGPSSE